MCEGRARYAHEQGAWFGAWFLELSGDVRHTLGPALNALLDQAFTATDKQTCMCHRLAR